MQFQRKCNFLFLAIVFSICVSSCSRITDNWDTTIEGIISFSSPKAADLNNDGVLDIVIGAGGEEWDTSDKGIVAIDGYTGKVIWTAPCKNQIIGSSVFEKLDSDNILDIVIGGRSGELYGISGKTGKVLWDFRKSNKQLNWNNKLLFNLYNPQFVKDQNGDNVKDFVICYGGEALLSKGVLNRKAGIVLLISGADGKILNQAEMPDSYESYASIVCFDCDTSNNPSFLFGTGGEDKPGSLYLATLQDLKNNNFSKSKKIDSSNNKGYEAPPILVDMNNDGVKDILFSTVSGETKLLNGKNYELIWKNKRDSAEVFSQIAVGHFTGNDKTLDIFVNYAIGEYPNYKYTEQRLFNGKDGSLVKKYKGAYFSYSSPLVVDLENDGIDEVLINNIDNANKAQSSMPYYEILVMDFKNNKSFTLGEKKLGACFASTPWIGDLDNDDKLDLIFTGSPSLIAIFPGSTILGKANKALQIHHYEFYNHPASGVKWGSYMGKDSKSIY